MGSMAKEGINREARNRCIRRAASEEGGKGGHKDVRFDDAQRQLSAQQCCTTASNTTPAHHLPARSTLHCIA